MLKNITGEPKQTIFWTVVGAVLVPVGIIVTGGDTLGGLLFGIPVGAFSGLITSLAYERMMPRSHSLPADESDDESEE